MARTIGKIGRPPKNRPILTSSPFKRMRLEAELSQEQLAQRIGVAVSTIRRWEKGQAEPTMTIGQFKKFTQAVGRHFDDLPDSLLPSVEIIDNLRTIQKS